MRLTLIASFAFTAITFGTGCVTRTVYVRDNNDAPAPQAQEPVAQAQPAPDDDAGIYETNQFYGPLSPYGSWVAHPAYGQVFVPSPSYAGAGFRPYTNGHWEYTEWGWTWVDHHPFGWATGHYGRWFYDNSYGWAWVPGTTWSPAWVSWRGGGGYVGWAPMGPGAYYGGTYNTYDSSWVYVYNNNMGAGYVGSVLIVGPGYAVCYGQTTPVYTTTEVYGRTYYRGPDPDAISRDGGRVIHRPISETERERPVTRPPEGTAIAREDDRNNRRGAPRDRDGRNDGSSRPAPGNDRGNPGTGNDRGNPGSGNDRGNPGSGNDRGNPGSGNDRGTPAPGTGAPAPGAGDPAPGRGGGNPRGDLTGVRRADPAADARDGLVAPSASGPATGTPDTAITGDPRGPAHDAGGTITFPNRGGITPDRVQPGRAPGQPGTGQPGQTATGTPSVGQPGTPNTDVVRPDGSEKLDGDLMHDRLLDGGRARPVDRASPVGPRGQRPTLAPPTAPSTPVERAPVVSQPTRDDRPTTPSKASKSRTSKPSKPSKGKAPAAEKDKEKSGKPSGRSR